MAATGTPTPNIGLRIPLGTDPASVDDINYNSNLLDTKLGAVGSDSVQDQIDTLNGNLTALGNQYANRFETIWTNPNPSQEFIAQDISPDMTGVRLIVVFFRYNTSSTLGMSHLVAFTGARDTAVMSNTNGSFAILTREIVLRASSISFSDCYVFTSTGSSTLDNTKMIPYRVLAIK